MKFKKIMALVLAAIFVASALPTAQVFGARTPNVENSTSHDVKKGKVMPQAEVKSLGATTSGTSVNPNSSPLSQVATPSAQTQAVQVSNLGPNIILNPSLETPGVVQNAQKWNRGGYGTNTRTLTYPVPGYNSASAQKVAITKYTNGDAKWFFNYVSVTPGQTYQFTDYSFSNIQSVITVQYQMTDGTFTYKDVATVNPSATFQPTTVQFTVPKNVASLTIFHLINKVGELTTDEFALNAVNSTTPPPPVPPTPPADPSNLVPNPNLENGDANGLPTSWNKNSWGTNTATFTYPATGPDGSKAAKVEITSYTTGDAKWSFNPISLSPGVYTYSDQYSSNEPSILTAETQNNDGTFVYNDIATVPASASFASASADFTVPVNAKLITVYHLIQGKGNLTIDNVSVKLKTGLSGIFSTGAVSLAFDDGWLSQYQVVIPKLNNVGFKGTFFIVSQQLADNGFADFMTKAQVANTFKMGHEIGAHTRTHPYLSQLTSAQQQDEIQGSRQDLLAMNVGQVTSFAYPYGDYNDTTLQIVKSAGFTAARSTIDGYTVPTTDHFQLPRLSMEINVTVATAKQWIDAAVANKQWLILTFHRVDSSGDQYSVTPDTFNQVVDYLKQKNVKVVTVAQGLNDLK